MKTLSLSIVLAGLLAPQVSAQPEITLTNLAALTWETTPEGVGFAALDGARFEEAYMAMVRLPAGTISPPHVKSANMFGVMVQGTMTHVAEGQGTPVDQPIGPGGFYKVPAGLPHVSSCISSTPCVTFLYQDGAFDFVPTGQ